MTFSKQLNFPLFLILILFFFPLRHASKPKKCPTSFRDTLSCGPSEVSIRFPFCDHPGFNLHCTNLDKTVLELPLSGTFLVLDINYRKQQIYINDPENCLAKRLLTFNISGSPFSSPLDYEYTFFTCPKEVVLPSRFQYIPCLSNSTASFFFTTNFEQESPEPLSCQLVKKFHGPTIFLNHSFLLDWHSPNCSSCEMDSMRCGLKNEASLEVKCFRDNTGLSNKAIVIIISVTIPVGVILFNICFGCIGCYLWKSESSDSDRRQHIVRHQPQEIMATTTTGLDQSTIESYKKMEVGESRRLPGINGTVCSICLSEYASKETVRCIPKCEHCFHRECIDVWLKIHGSCPLCRNLPSPVRETI